MGNSLPGVGGGLAICTVHEGRKENRIIKRHNKQITSQVQATSKGWLIITSPSPGVEFTH